MQLVVRHVEFVRNRSQSSWGFYVVVSLLRDRPAHLSIAFPRLPGAGNKMGKGTEGSDGMGSRDLHRSILSTTMTKKLTDAQMAPPDDALRKHPHSSAYSCCSAEKPWRHHLICMQLPPEAVLGCLWRRFSWSSIGATPANHSPAHAPVSSSSSSAAEADNGRLLSSARRYHGYYQLQISALA